MDVFTRKLWISRPPQLCLSMSCSIEPGVLDDDDEEVDEEESDGDDGVAGKNLDEAMTSHGDL